MTATQRVYLNTIILVFKIIHDILRECTSKFIVKYTYIYDYSHWLLHIKTYISMPLKCIPITNNSVTAAGNYQDSKVLFVVKMMTDGL